MAYQYSISIIIPFYNAATYITKCVESLMQQTLSNIEYIFVNDASIDNSIELLVEVISRYPEKKSSVKIISAEKNGGSAVSRNIGIKQAQGEFIGWVDADDWVEKNMFEDMYQHAIKCGADIVYADYYQTENGTTKLIKQEEVLDKITLIDKLMPGDLKGALWNKLIKHTLYIDNNVDFVNGADMGEDMQALVKLYFFSKKISYLPKAHYHWVRNDNSMMSTSFKMREKNQGWIRNIEEVSRFIDKYNIQGVSRGLNLLKVGAKHNVLVRAKNSSDLKKWKEIFPESNSYIWKKPYPLYYKIFGWCIYRDIPLIPFVWLKMKSLLGK